MLQNEFNFETWLIYLFEQKIAESLMKIESEEYSDPKAI